MRAFKCDNCGALVEGFPRASVVAKAGNKDCPYCVAVSYVRQSKRPELCKGCLLEVMEKAYLACRANIEKED